ncbi:ZC21C protein, partial [Jacana jacana]|nr:ZC21C protein [Jacana jacana]
VEHWKNNCRHELTPKKEESLKDLSAQKRQSYSYSLSAERSQQSFRHGDVSSAGLQSKHLTRQTKTLPPKSVAKRKEGVDRAHPLKPIFHHEDAGVHTQSVCSVANRVQDRSSLYMEETPNTRPSSRNNGKPQAGRAQLDAVLPYWTAQPTLSAPYLYRNDQAYILKLEQEGWAMGEEIEKKKAILREKLMRAEESLRRIQREKELAKAEERRAREAERTHEQKAARHLEEKAFRNAVKPGNRVFDGVRSAEANIPKARKTLHPQEPAMGKLNKEQLVASRGKIQDRIPMEHLTSYSELPRKPSPSLSDLPDRDSDADLYTGVLYTQATSAVMQGELGQCSFCGRMFLCTRLEKHMNVCGKIQGSKRKAYDSSRARARGTELEQFKEWHKERPQNKMPRKNNWRQKHEALIRTLRQAQQLQPAPSKGKTSEVPQLPPIENPDYVACPYCGRRFAPRVAERHIPKCKNIKSRPPPPPHMR